MKMFLKVPEMVKIGRRGPDMTLCGTMKFSIWGPSPLFWYKGGLIFRHFRHTKLPLWEGGHFGGGWRRSKIIATLREGTTKFAKKNFGLREEWGQFNQPRIFFQEGETSVNFLFDMVKRFWFYFGEGELRVELAEEPPNGSKAAWLFLRSFVSLHNCLFQKEKGFLFCLKKMGKKSNRKNKGTNN